MRTKLSFLFIMVCAMAIVNVASADTFGTGSNQFTIDFVPISGSTNPTSGYGIVNNTYRMGTYEITNGQWNKFQTSLGVPVTGTPSTGYDLGPSYTATNVPFNNTGWGEAAQFVNWLNTSTGHHAAYNFTGTQGTGAYTFTTWSPAEASGGTNLYRHKDALYFLPTEDEWVKAAYWNGTSLQAYATKAGESLTKGNGTSGTGWNYGWATVQPWAVGSGSEELNGTFDMMDNVWEWMESPYVSGDYGANSLRGLRGGAFYLDDNSHSSSNRTNAALSYDEAYIGFRVASVPEPATLLLLGLGAVMLRKNK